MSDTLTLNEQIRVEGDWDVVVAGGGPSGCTAAAAAAREGARTLLVEATGSLGGMGTSGLVPAWCPFTDQQRIIYGGMAERVLKQTMAGMPHVPPTRYDWTPIDPERLKRVYDDLVGEAGAEIRFNTMVASVVKEGDGIQALVLGSKAGLTAARARVFVDATGDGDLAAWAGVPFEKGDDAGDMQPATHCFMLANVDAYAYAHCGGIKYGPEPNVINQIVASGRYPLIPDTHACNNQVGPGVVGFNAGHIWGVDNTDPASVSRALVHGRRIAASFRDACAEFFPKAFANSYLVATGALLGIRETRRIRGDYTLTVDDWRVRRSFDDEIARNCYFIDVHHSRNECDRFTKGGKHGQPDAPAVRVPAEHMRSGESHGIPYRCLLPVGLRNVLVTGRCISTDRIVQGSTRVMPVCLSVGEAAGIAAAQAARGDGGVRNVDVAALRARLKAMGAWLP